jgi:hypothetical protein
MAHHTEWLNTHDVQTATTSPTSIVKHEHEHEGYLPLLAILYIFTVLESYDPNIAKMEVICNSNLSLLPFCTIFGSELT